MTKIEALKIFASGLGYPEALNGSETTAEAIAKISTFSYDVEGAEFTATTDSEHITAGGKSFIEKRRGLAGIRQLYATLDISISAGASGAVTIECHSVPTDEVHLPAGVYGNAIAFWEAKGEGPSLYTHALAVTSKPIGDTCSFTISEVPAAGEYVLHLIGTIVE